MKKLFVLTIVLQLSFGLFGGCHWLGRTAGKIEKGAKVAADKVEEGAADTARHIDKMERDLERGYKEGSR